MEKYIEKLEMLEQQARELVERLAPKPHATLITLSGELGAGKTAFVQFVAKTLGVEDTVTSPTFVLEKIYDLPARGNSFHRLVHIDAYRLESGVQLKALGFDELSADSNNLIFLEWPERVADALPTPDISITLVANTDNSRTMTYA